MKDSYRLNALICLILLLGYAGLMNFLIDCLIHDSEYLTKKELISSSLILGLLVAGAFVCVGGEIFDLIYPTKEKSIYENKDMD